MSRIPQPGPIDAPKLQSAAGSYCYLATKLVVVSIILFTAAISAFAQSFAAPVNYPTGSGPYAVATGDFNGDGKVDLASANNFTKNVSVLLGNGDTTFGPKTDYDVASYAYGIVCVDLNGDTKLDLATATSVGLDSGISVLLGNGNGTFQAKVDYPFSGLAQPNSLVTADLNNDNKADLVVVNGSGASVFLGNGNGTLKPPVSYGSSNFAGSVAVGNFNADGKLDLAVCSYGVGSNGVVSVMLGNGDGTFQTPVNYSTAPSPFAIAASDFNADGKLDLATANVQVASSSILLGNGDGTFQSAVSYPAGGFPFGIAVGDFNVDGKGDVLIAGNGGSITILSGNGDGTFRSPVTFQIGAFFATVLELNGDSKPDFITAGQSESLSVVLNQTGPHSISGIVRDSNGTAMSGVGIFLSGGAAQFITTDVNGAYAFHDLGAGGNYTVTPSKTNYAFTPPNLSISNLSSNVTGDFTGTLLHYSITGTVRDTFTNVMPGVTVTLAGSQSQAATTSADGSFSFTDLPGGGNYVVTPSLAKTLFTASSATINNLSSNRVLGFVGRPATYRISGSVSLVGSFSSFSLDNITVLLSGTKFGTAVTNSSGYSFDNLPVDGDYTVTAYSSTANSLFSNIVMVPPAVQSVTGLSANTVLNFTAKRLAAGTGNFDPVGLAQGDLNGDGKPDVVVTTSTGSNIHVLLGNGDGTLQPQVAYNSGGNPTAVVMSDFNGDGKLDVASGSGSGLGIHIGNGDGTLQSQVNYPLGETATWIVVSDLNSDGKKDLAVLITNNKLSVLLGNGNGTFQPAVTKSVPTAVGNVSAGDFNADNKPDLAMSGYQDSMLVLLGNGDGTFADPVSYVAGTTVRRATVADINADGKLDLAVANDTGFTILLGNGNGTFQTGITQSLLANTNDIVSADFDGDGKLDLVTANSSGGITFASGNGDGTFKPAVIYAAGQYMGFLAVADFNNDGARDIAVPSSGSTEVLVLLNTSPTRPPALQFANSTYTFDEAVGSAVVTVTRSDSAGAARVQYTTSDNNTANNCSVTGGSASARCDYNSSLGTLFFAPGESTQTISIPITNDSYHEFTENFFVRLSGEFGANLGPNSTTIVSITDNDSVTGPNAIDQADFFVRQHYIDFLNREADASGLAFWSNQITECQQPGATCDAEVRRINVSAAFFLSIEFQETGYLVERLYKSAYGDAAGVSNFGTIHTLLVPNVRFSEFLPDTQQIGKGVVIGQPGAEQRLESNKVAFTQEFVTRARFLSFYPTTMTPAQYVDGLFTKAGVTPGAAERSSIINEFGGAAIAQDVPARARALRRVAENSTLTQQEKNKAFVLMQYFGYMRRNPNDQPDTDYTGYDFWLTKLNDFNGNFVNAEMVKAFIVSGEYRHRFGP